MSSVAIGLITFVYIAVIVLTLRIFRYTDDQ